MVHAKTIICDQWMKVNAKQPERLFSLRTQQQVDRYKLAVGTMSRLDALFKTTVAQVVIGHPTSTLDRLAALNWVAPTMVLPPTSNRVWVSATTTLSAPLAFNASNVRTTKPFQDAGVWEAAAIGITATTRTERFSDIGVYANHHHHHHHLQVAAFRRTGRLLDVVPEDHHQ